MFNFVIYIYSTYIVSTYFLNLDSVLVVYDDFMRFSKMADSLNDALTTHRDSLFGQPELAVHWMHITNQTSNEEYFNILFENVEIGLQVNFIIEYLQLK